MKQITILALLLILQCSTTFAVNYGDVYEVGTTYWSEQQNATVGKMIVRDGLGGTHFTWTKALDEGLSERHVYYNFCDDDSGDIEDQFAANASCADQGDRAGYASIDLYPDGETMLATCFYHASMSAVMAIDWERGFGAFSEEMFQLQNRMAIPIVVKGTIDRNQNAHIVAVSNPMQPDALSFGLTIWHGLSNGNPFEWDKSIGFEIENTTGLSHRIQASRESDRVALAWHHNLVGVPAPERWENSDAHGMNNDLYLIESPDGDEWDLDNPFNITRTIPADNDREGLLAYGDTLRPYNDVDLIYVGDVVHAVFTTRGFIADPRDIGDPPVIDWTTEESFIWHWDSESDTLTLVADGWYDNEGILGSLYSNVDRPSLAADESGKLYCIFKQVSDEDVDDNNVCVSDVILALSEDGGITWSEPINLTGTIYDDEDRVSDFISEMHPSIAETVDDCLHIFYLLACVDLGGMGEPEVVEYPMIYQRIAVEDLPEVGVLEMPRDNFTYHNLGNQSVNNELVNGQPIEFGINGVYPNPFNSRTSVQVDVPSTEPFTLAVMDVSGRQMAILHQGQTAPGSYTFNWNAESYPAGIYFINLKWEKGSTIRKVALVK